jgi:hypothetical protein
LARPQRKRQTDLIGAAASDQASQPIFLCRAQRFLLARAATPTPARQDRLARLIGRLDPLTDKPAVHPHRLSRFDPRLAGSHHRHCDAAQLRLRRRGQLIASTLVVEIWRGREVVIGQME